MGLVDEVRSMSRTYPTCSLAAVRAALTVADQAELDELLADASVPATHIALALRNRGHAIQGQTLQRHRRGDCSCS